MTLNILFMFDASFVGFSNFRIHEKNAPSGCTCRLPSAAAVYENLMRYESVGDDPYGERPGLRGMESDSSSMLHSMIDEILSR